jgi:hypothetical protein
MEIIRDEERIARLRRISQITSFLGMGALIIGMILVFVGDIQTVFTYQLLALLFGWLLSQIGIYLGHRYIRSPRPDEVLDQTLRKIARKGRMYHYVLPAPHVLLLPTGVMLFVTKYQAGNISVEGDKWKQRGLGLRRLFGQEQLGNPTREAENYIKATASYISKHAPEVEEVPMAVVIVFTTKGNNELDLKDSSIPAMHYTKLKGFMRRRKGDTPLPEADFAALQKAFDDKAGDLVAAADDVEEAVSAS